MVETTVELKSETGDLDTLLFKNKDICWVKRNQTMETAFFDYVKCNWEFHPQSKKIFFLKMLYWADFEHE